MKPVGPWERAYFAAVGLFALSVGIFGFFIPSRATKVLPFPVPPLHARFLGAMHLSGLTFMVGAVLSRSWAEVRIVPPMTAIWTGGLLVVSRIHFDAFDLAELPDQVWFAAYVAYPLIASWLTWRHRSDAHERVPGPLIPAWATVCLGRGGDPPRIGAVPCSGLDGGRLAVGDHSLLAQLYAAPLLSYGVGSLLLSRQRTWPEVRVCVVAMLVFAALVLVGSLLHLDLFDSGDVVDSAWFVGFAVATACLAVLAVESLRGSARGSIRPASGVEAPR